MYVSNLFIEHVSSNSNGAEFYSGTVRVSTRNSDASSSFLLLIPLRLWRSYEHVITESTLCEINLYFMESTLKMDFDNVSSGTLSMHTCVCICFIS